MRAESRADRLGRSSWEWCEPEGVAILRPTRSIGLACETDGAERVGAREVCVPSLSITRSSSATSVFCECELAAIVSDVPGRLNVPELRARVPRQVAELSVAAVELPLTWEAFGGRWISSIACVNIFIIFRVFTWFFNLFYLEFTFKVLYFKFIMGYSYVLFLFKSKLFISILNLYLFYIFWN